MNHTIAMAPRLVLGVASGLLLGILTALSPALAIGAMAAIIVVTSIELIRASDRGRAMFLAGVLIGAGGLLAFGTANTVRACAQTEDFCGNANVLPLGAFAALVVAAGAVAALIVARRSE